MTDSTLVSIGPGIVRAAQYRDALRTGAWHEGGHAAAILVPGGNPIVCYVRPDHIYDPAGGGSVPYERGAMTAEDVAVMALAGYLAVEELYPGHTSGSPFNAGDCAILNDAARELGITDVPAWCRVMIRRTRAFVLEHRVLIRAIACELLLYDALSGDQLCALAASLPRS